MGLNLNKITKSIKKTTKKATKAVNKAVKSTADVAKDACDGASKAAMGAADAVEQAAKDAYRGIKQVQVADDVVVQISRDAAATLETFGEDVEGVVEDVAAQIERWIDDAVMEMLQALANDMLRDLRKQITALAKAGQAIATSPERMAIVERLGRQAARKKCDSKTEKDMQTLGAIPEVKAASSHLSRSGSADPKVNVGTEPQPKKDDSKYTLRSISIGLGGNAAYGPGVEGGYGFAMDYAGHNIKGVVCVGGQLCMSAGPGVGLGVQIGYWIPASDKLSGPYIAVEGELDIDLYGANAQVVFAIPTSAKDWTKASSYAPVGYVVGMNAAMLNEDIGVSLALGSGYTWQFDGNGRTF